jgi:hypothetical protein
MARNVEVKARDPDPASSLEAALALGEASPIPTCFCTPQQP